jgi:transcriptional regulator with XRE-family HTH domain
VARSTFKSLRKRTRLSQKEFAKKLGINPQYVSSIERGGAAMPAKYLPKISKVCEVPLEKLIRMSVRNYEQEIRRRAGV